MRPRVVYLRERHAEAMHVLARRQMPGSRLSRTPTSAFDHALAFDPTPEASYMPAILRWFARGAIRFEDGRRVRTVLERFHRLKPRLPVERRDIARYGSPGDIEDLVSDPAIATTEGMPAAAASGTRVLLESGGWSLVEAVDFAAAEWWAQGTAWCTQYPRSARNYLAQGPLFIIAGPETRYQFHLASGQLMDRLDREVLTLREVPREIVDAAVACALARATEIDGFRDVGVARALDRLAEGRRRESDLPIWLTPDGFEIRDDREDFKQFYIRSARTGEQLSCRDIESWNELPADFSRAAANYVRAAIPRHCPAVEAGTMPPMALPVTGRPVVEPDSQGRPAVALCDIGDAGLLAMELADDGLRFHELYGDPAAVPSHLRPVLSRMARTPGLSPIATFLVDGETVAFPFSEPGMIAAAMEWLDRGPESAKMRKARAAGIDHVFRETDRWGPREWEEALSRMERSSPMVRQRLADEMGRLGVGPSSDTVPRAGFA